MSCKGGFVSAWIPKRDGQFRLKRKPEKLGSTCCQSIDLPAKQYQRMANVSPCAGPARVPTSCCRFAAVLDKQLDTLFREWHPKLPEPTRCTISCVTAPRFDTVPCCQLPRYLRIERHSITLFAN